MKIITGASKTQYNAADGAMKRTQKVDARLDQAMKVGDAFTKLDTSVDEYTEKITDLDGRLTTQMTSYQDELMQMQHNLESGLDTMAEVLAAPTEDAAAIAELNGYFTNFQFDIERTLERQQELRTLQMEYSANLDKPVECWAKASPVSSTLPVLGRSLTSCEERRPDRPAIDAWVCHAAESVAILAHLLGSIQLTWPAQSHFSLAVLAPTSAMRVLERNIELKQKINELQQKKSTRDEVTDALSDKAGIAALNGLVTMEQYQAVRGDFEKRIGHAYDKFNNKEITWQKAIDDLVRELNEKTDLHQLVYLNKEIQKYLTLMRKYLDDMLALVGDIDPITTKRKVERSDNCLSCGTQFNAETDEDLSETRPPVIDSIRFNVLVSGPIETLSNDETAARGRGITK
ncbi:hypothetical protein MSG28_007580 [Choristoneura fumiferana]|uniref:Uncharacterized protein n=1 Tax=Choristoneura fumiferana TaxID=7141 RepID=A0ACC0JXN6_CHOFU|nr:hypothetical protein MSG28_007580 [Choristoneura fumiferana]